MTNLALLAAACTKLDKCNRLVQKNKPSEEPKKPNFFTSAIAKIKQKFTTIYYNPTPVQ
jgi:hypothetical protein